MSTEIVPAASALVVAELRRDAEAAADAAKHDRAWNTRRAYAEDWRQFEEWAKQASLQALPAQPETVVLWLGHLQRTGSEPSTVGRKLSAVSMKHREAGLPSPRDDVNVRKVVSGFEKKKGIRQKQANPIMQEDLARAVAATGDDLRGVRDQALVLVGWLGAFRRSELVALTVDDVTFVDEGAILLVKRSKTDQRGEGLYKALFHAEQRALCPVAALQRWLQLVKIDDGPIFRKISKKGLVGKKALHPETVRALVRKLLGDDFTAHSLRAGFVTQAGLKGSPIWEIKRQTGQRSDATVQKYLRPRSVMRGNAAKGLL